MTHSSIIHLSLHILFPPFPLFTLLTAHLPYTIIRPFKCCFPIYSVNSPHDTFIYHSFVHILFPPFPLLTLLTAHLPYTISFFCPFRSCFLFPSFPLFTVHLPHSSVIHLPIFASSNAFTNLSLPAAFSQPGRGLLAGPCTSTIPYSLAREKISLIQKRQIVPASCFMSRLRV